MSNVFCMFRKFRVTISRLGILWAPDWWVFCTLDGNLSHLILVKCKQSFNPPASTLSSFLCDPNTFSQHTLLVSLICNLYRNTDHLSLFLPLTLCKILTQPVCRRGRGSFFLSLSQSLSMLSRGQTLTLSLPRSVFCRLVLFLLRLQLLLWKSLSFVFFNFFFFALASLSSPSTRSSSSPSSLGADGGEGRNQCKYWERAPRPGLRVPLMTFYLFVITMVTCNLGGWRWDQSAIEQSFFSSFFFFIFCGTFEWGHNASVHRL